MQMLKSKRGKSVRRHVSIVLGIVVGIGAVIGSSIASADTTVTYDEDRSNFANPERGWFHAVTPTFWNNTIAPRLTVMQLQGYRSENVTVVRKYYLIAAFKNGSPLSKEILDHFESDLNTSRIACVKLVPRFTYSWNTEMSKEDGSLDATLKHLEQLGPLFQEHSDVIARVELGLIGYWGELHDSTSGHVDDDQMGHPFTDSGLLIVAKMLDEVPATRMIQFRSPKQNRQFCPVPITAKEAFGGSDRARVGQYNDGFFRNEIDFGTYSPDPEDREGDKRYLEQSMKYVPMTGEPGGADDEGYVFKHDPIPELERMHWDMMNRNWSDAEEQGVYAHWRKTGAYDVMSRRLGYRFRLVSATIPDSATSGEKFAMTLRLANDGFSSPFNPRGLELVLREKTTRMEYHIDLTADHDPRFWGAGEHRLNINTQLPEIPSGSYSLLLNLPDPETKLRGRPAYSIRLANKGVWESETGYNQLLHRLSVCGTLRN